MKRFIILLCILGVLLSSSVFAGSLELNMFNPGNTASAKPGETVTFNLNLKNTDPEKTMSNILFDTTNLSYSTYNMNKPVINPIGSLANGTSINVSFSILVPNGQEAGKYKGSITVHEKEDTTLYNSAIINYDLVVELAPKIELPSKVTLNVAPGDSKEISFEVKNIGNVVLTGIKITGDIDLIDNDKDEITLTISASTFDLAVGASKTITLNADVENSFEVDSIKGYLVFNVANEEKKIPLEINVKPVVCQYGLVGDLDINVDDPSSDDEFEPGDSVHITVNVDNKGDDDADVVVEAMLYNTDKNKKVAKYTSPKHNINEDEDYDFEFYLKISDDYNTDDTLKLFVKAYEYKNEDDNCDEYEDSLDIVEVENKVAIKSFSISPSSVQCGELVEGTLSVKNIGTNDQDVVATIQSTQLGISQSTPIFKLGTDSDDNSEIARASIKIPATAKEGTYVVSAILKYSGKETKADQTIQIYGCGSQAATGQPTGNQSTGSGIIGEKSAGIGTGITGGTIYTSKDIFDSISDSLNAPSSVWILVDILLVIGIIALLVVIFRRR